VHSDAGDVAYPYRSGTFNSIDLHAYPKSNLNAAPEEEADVMKWNSKLAVNRTGKRRQKRRKKRRE
jgi:hypothetical protein